MLLTIPIIVLVVLPYTTVHGQASPRSYAAQYTQCPSEFTRKAGTVEKGDQKLNDKEAAYIEERRSRVIPSAYRSYLDNVEESLRGQRQRLPLYVRRHLRGERDDRPHVSAAVSGGGLRASYFGAGVLNALDGRNLTSAKAGTGGLLQALDYITGLSGGACLVMSLASANFPDMYDLSLGPQDSDRGWLTDMNFIVPATIDLVRNGLWWSTIAADVASKLKAGFKVSIADLYSRVLAYHYLRGTDRRNFFDPEASHARGDTFSSLGRVTPTILNYSQPFPIITAIPESPGQSRANLIPGNPAPLSNNQYEFSIYEFGSWDPNLSAFITTQYLGSTPDSDRCVEAHDNLGFLIAASSNIFRKVDNLASLISSKAYFPILPRIDEELSLIPNPFQGMGTEEFLDQNSEYLELMDGSFAGENIPFAPLLVPARSVDVILAIDASDDTQAGYPNGDSLLATSERSRMLPAKAYPFPNLNDTSGLDVSKPSFIGCEDGPGVPLVVYIPNADSVPNVPTASLQVSEETGRAVLDSATSLAITSDPLWPGCLACAVVDRSRAREGEKRTGLCADCFDRYCFNSESCVKDPQIDVILGSLFTVNEKFVIDVDDLPPKGLEIKLVNLLMV